jgi:hypothetical protein
MKRENFSVDGNFVYEGLKSGNKGKNRDQGRRGLMQGDKGSKKFWNFGKNRFYGNLRKSKFNKNNLFCKFER